MNERTFSTTNQFPRQSFKDSCEFLNSGNTEVSCDKRIGEWSSFVNGRYTTPSEDVIPSFEENYSGQSDKRRADAMSFQVRIVN